MIDESAYEAFAKRNNNDEASSEVAALKGNFLSNLNIWLNRNRDAGDFRPLIRKILLQDRQTRLSEEEVEDFDTDTMNDYAFLLANYRSLPDVLFIWHIKAANIHSHMTLRQHYLVFCGVNETKEFLMKEGSELAAAALDWIVGCDDAGDFEDLDGYIGSAVRDYNSRDYYID